MTLIFKIIAAPEKVKGRVDDGWWMIADDDYDDDGVTDSFAPAKSIQA